MMFVDFGIIPRWYLIAAGDFISSGSFGKLMVLRKLFFY
jgi:hypothetical protein